MIAMIVTLIEANSTQDDLLALALIVMVDRVGSTIHKSTLRIYHSGVSVGVRIQRFKTCLFRLVSLLNRYL